MQNKTANLSNSEQYAAHSDIQQMEFTNYNRLSKNKQMGATRFGFKLQFDSNDSHTWQGTVYDLDTRNAIAKDVEIIIGEEYSIQQLYKEHKHQGFSPNINFVKKQGGKKFIYIGHPTIKGGFDPITWLIIAGVAGVTAGAAYYIYKHNKPDIINPPLPQNGGANNEARRQQNQRPANQRQQNQRPANPRQQNQRQQNQRPANPRPANQRPANQRPANQRPANPRQQNQRQPKPEARESKATKPKTRESKATKPKTTKPKTSESKTSE